MAEIRGADKTLLPHALRKNRGYHVATEWYLNGWIPLPYQYAFHQQDIMNTTFIAGIAAGKTTAVAASYFMDCLTIPHFRALNTSVTARQAILVFDMIEAWINDNDRLNPLIENITLRPYPTITFKNYSEWEFRTCGTDARFIRGSEYDRINFDEAGLEHTGGVVKVLRGRLRGTRPDGSLRMARLDCITSPTDAPWLRERFAKGEIGNLEADLSLYRSMRVETYDNTRLTREQIKAMEADYPPEMIDVELRGMFPDYGFSMFPSGHVNACTYQELYDDVVSAVFPESGNPKPGYELAEDPRHGIIKFEKPLKPGRIYVMGGDPGTENYPKRSAGVVMVADVTEMPKKEIVYFDWVSGRGSYNPFLTSYKYALTKYDPVLRGIDATGTQKALDELAFENHGIHTDKLNFGADKTAMLNALSLDLGNHRWAFPPISGLKRQLGQYSLDRDRKIAQDIVMTMAEISHLSRFVPEVRDEKAKPKKANHRNRKQRTSTAKRR
jgi:hypothetical protein